MRETDETFTKITPVNKSWLCSRTITLQPDCTVASEEYVHVSTASAIIASPQVPDHALLKSPIHTGAASFHWSPFKLLWHSPTPPHPYDYVLEYICSYPIPVPVEPGKCPKWFSYIHWTQIPIYATI